MAPFASILDGVAFCPLLNRTQIEVAGPDAISFLHNFCTQEVKDLKVGRGAETFFCDVRGKTIGHGMLYRRPDSIVVETVPNQGESLSEHLDRYLITEDVQIHDRSSEWAMVAILGRAATELLLGSNTQSSPATTREVASEPLSIPLADVDSASLELRCTPAYVAPAYHLRCAAGDADKIAEQLSRFGAAALPEQTLDGIRIAAGWPNFGIDITTDSLPQEIDRDSQAISFVKGCYLGQETVARIDALGHVNWKLRGVVSHSPLSPELELRVDEKPVGVVRSTTRAAEESENKSLGMALIRREHSAVGNTLVSDAGELTIVDLPLRDWLGE